MRLRSCSVAALVALAATAAPAVAAPARTGTLGVDHTEPFTWTFGPGTGVLSDATVASKVPCTAPLQTCDSTLIEVTDPGTLTVGTTSADPTLVDLDLYLFTSDETGAQGDQLASGVTFSPTETVAADVDPGYYLVRADYMTGAGSYSGTASYTPLPPEE
jgi:hypothetical protein